MMKRICVYCGARNGRRDRDVQAARAMGREIAERGLTLVYGGGHVGLMGALSDAALAAGGQVIGIIPEQLVNAELAHRGLSRLEVVQSMHERKARMAELADAFIALPGGFGTLDETFEILTWAQLGLHGKPCGLLEVDDFYAPLLAWIDRVQERVDHLLSLVNDVLDLSKIESGKFKLEIESVRIDELVEVTPRARSRPAPRTGPPHQACDRR